MRRFDLSLYLVLDPGLCAGIGMVATARAAVAGGVTTVQLRDKDGTTAARVETGRALKAALAGTGVPLIVNDDIEAAIAIGADGVHVGQGDVAALEARRRIGRDMILGLSISTVGEASSVDPTIVDHVGVGPVFPTATKPGHRPAIGLAGLAAVCAASPVPAVAIGGLKAEYAGACLTAGAHGIAVVSAICGQPDPRGAAAALALCTKEARP